MCDIDNLRLKELNNKSIVVRSKIEITTLVALKNKLMGRKSTKQ